MSIQEASITNNQKKRLLKEITNEEILFQDDNGDLVLNIAAYIISKKSLNSTPVELVMDDDNFLDNKAEFCVFS